MSDEATAEVTEPTEYIVYEPLTDDGDKQFKDANLTFRGRLSKRNSTEYIFLHHAAGDGSVLAIHNAHLALGWSGIGYNFYVRKDGSIWKGRGLDTVGAHAGGNYNSRSVGVCAEGNFQREFMFETQKRSLIELLAYVWSEYPQAKVVGHRDMDYTACPGRNYPFGEIVSGAQKLMAAKPKPPEIPPAPAPATPQATGSENCIEFPDLVRGTSGSLVESMQVLLIHKHKKSCGRWGSDSKFGAGTELGLNNFKRSIGLPPDGKCDIATWKKLHGL